MYKDCCRSCVFCVLKHTLFSIAKQWTIFPPTLRTHLISNVVWIHVTLLWLSGTIGAESTLGTLCNAVIWASAIGKAEMLESWVEMGPQSSCYPRNHSMEYHITKWFKEVKAIPDPNFSRSLLLREMNSLIALCSNQ